MKRPEKKLVLENGQEFYGIGFGADCRRVCEIVFNTSVVGYQEIVSDPSYAEQIVVMTYPLIGNYGITDEDFESRTPSIGGLVVRECCDTPSNFRYTKTLEEELEERGIPCLSGVDTRMLTKIIRDSGRPMAAIVEAEMPKEEALKLIAATERPKDLVRRVSCRKRWVTRTSGHKYHVVAVDCGIKYSIISHLKERGCNVTIVPFNASAEDIIKQLYSCEYRLLISDMTISPNQNDNLEEGAVDVNMNVTFFETTEGADTEEGIVWEDDEEDGTSSDSSETADTSSVSSN